MKRVLSLFLALCMTVTLFAGCSKKAAQTNQQNEQQQQTEQKKEPVTITVATFSDAFGNKWEKEVADEFMKQNPDIKVNLEQYPGDFFKALENKFIANQAPDVFYLDIVQAPSLINAGKVEPIDDYISKYNYDIDDIVPSLRQAFTWDGKLYGIAKDYNMLGLFYNKEMFEKKGLKPPTNWEELRQCAKMLTTKDVKGLALQNEIARFQPLAYQNGGSMMDGQNPKVNRDENIKAAEFWTSLFKDGLAVEPKDIGEGWDGDAFGKGKVAMTIEGGWMCKYLQNTAPNLKYGVVELPVNKTKSTMAFTVAWGIASTSPNKDAAFKFVSFITNKDNQRKVIPEQNALPSRISLHQEFKDKFPMWDAFTKSYEYAAPYNYGIAGTTVIDEVGKALEKIKLKKSDAKSAFDEAQKNIEAYLADVK
ncbi:carbohydrate ABC transporter substrate-binding protein, CUT1 family [Caloramator quimbayensis]|uniref:Carbohydrate ABC transporter substrate-binding protein, CUT1 family n=1 Tax=Caloramator quimbayensis TaxID=1147123 RepID=A0A1T4WPT7_9CLOT|nr:ABC transporter substrate-binding protein [Caloramator quimbayensis]SKA78631.1 carbohydrate ABC transporter substrate-binding protein, CUT1 family [Caloramator quimbayensis]